MKLDILVLCAHPDDAELGCSGTIARQIAKGYKVGIVDLTAGELGTRGDAETRQIEATNSSSILKLALRENLGLADGFFSEEKEDCIAVIRAIRKYKPDIILGNAPEDRHPDHGRAGALILKANFLSGLIKIATNSDQKTQEPWRANHVFHFIQDRYLVPDFVVDISAYWETKVAAIQAFKTQFYTPGADGPETYISTPAFMQFIEARASEMGHAIGTKYGEGYIKAKQIAVDDLMLLG